MGPGRATWHATCSPRACNFAGATRVLAAHHCAAGEYERPMAKLNHQKRHRPRPAPLRRRRITVQRAEEQRSRRDLERWRRSV